MVTPDRRRIAVERVQQRFGVSERRACAVVGQPRSTQRRPKAPTDDAEARLREHLRDFARCRPRLGWRKAHVVAHREGLVTNPKRTRRVWRDEGLQRPPQRKAKRRRLTDGTAARLRAQRPNDVWALDFQFDETADLRRVTLLNRHVPRKHGAAKRRGNSPGRGPTDLPHHIDRLRVESLRREEPRTRTRRRHNGHVPKCLCACFHEVGRRLAPVCDHELLSQRRSGRKIPHRIIP